MSRKPPEFTLNRLDALLAEKAAEDDAGLARRGLRIPPGIGGPGLVAALRNYGMSCLMQISDPVSSCTEIAERLRLRIQSGELRPGDLLPTAADLATRHGVHAKTVRRATDQLRAEGLVTLRGKCSRLVVVPPGAEFTCGQCGVISTRPLMCCGRMTGVLGWPAEEPQAVSSGVPAVAV